MPNTFWILSYLIPRENVKSIHHHLKRLFTTLTVHHLKRIPTGDWNGFFLKLITESVLNINRRCYATSLLLRNIYFLLNTVSLFYFISAIKSCVYWWAISYNIFQVCLLLYLLNKLGWFMNSSCLFNKLNKSRDKIYTESFTRIDCLATYKRLTLLTKGSKKFDYCLGKM